MSKGRLEAFSDAVIAILITIMVLELRPPEGSDLQSLLPIGADLLGYMLSFAMLGVYWNNHHHLLQASRVVDGRVIVANLLLMFALSLVPFATAWMARTHFVTMPTALYAAVSLACAVAYYLLVRTLITTHGQDGTLARAIGSDRKGRISIVGYVAAVPVALVFPAGSIAILAAILLLWVVPDKRIERVLAPRE